MLKKINIIMKLGIVILFIFTVSSTVNAQSQSDSFEGLTKNEFEEKIDKKITDEEWNDITNHGRNQ